MSNVSRITYPFTKHISQLIRLIRLKNSPDRKDDREGTDGKKIKPNI